MILVFIKVKNRIVKQVRIGTSNIVIPGNKQSFPSPFHLKSRLHYYSTLFNSVELNSTFYKIPMRSTFQKWSMDVPDDFQFTIKLTKEITHIKNLAYDLGLIEKFISAARGTGAKKGCLLIQFPGKITFGYFEQVEMILHKLAEADAGNEWKRAVEFRHPSWYIGEAYELLDEYNTSMVLHDIFKAKSIDLNKKARFVYLRFHGPEGDYRGTYANDFLQQKAIQVRNWVQQGKEVYAYFNNTMGDAYNNAVQLKRLLEL